LTEKELKEAISYLITYHSKLYSIPKIEALIGFLFYSGIRKSELLGLKRSDFNVEESMCKVYGKGRKERYIYYPSQIKEKIITYFKSEDETSNAFNISLYDITYLTKILKKYFPNKNITVHLFRHSGARNMIDKGIPLGTVSRLLGHSSIQTTIIYTDPNQETIKRQYQEKMK
jgi:integrase/recombinase XerD